LRLGHFHRSLLEWAEKPCLLTVAVAATGSGLTFAGVLRAYYSLQSLHGWALVPPQQHGGFAAIRLTQLHIEDSILREVVDDGPRRLRYSSGRDTVFELTRDEAVLTAPPRATRDGGRYLYVGGRRRPVPEDWMLQ
jgi:hypothetical protein